MDATTFKGSSYNVFNDSIDDIASTISNSQEEGLDNIILIPPQHDANLSGALFSLGGNPIQGLSIQQAHKLSAALMMEENDYYCRMKSIRSAGVAPTRFNLSKIMAGRYAVSYIPRIQREWKSLRAKHYWNRVRAAVIDIDDELDELNNEQNEDDKDRKLYNLVVPQGFSFKGHYRNEHQILASVHHVKIPVHYMDGSLGHENDEDKGEEIRVNDEDEFNDKSNIARKTHLYQIAMVDKKNRFILWDINTMQSKTSPRLPYRLSQLVFISKNFIYAGLSSGNIIKFFTPKLEFSSSKTVPHHVQILRYNESTHELIAAGTHIITVWSLAASHVSGTLKIEATLRLKLETDLPENIWLDYIYIYDRLYQIYVALDTSIMVFDLTTGERLEYTNNLTTRRISFIAHHHSYQYMLLGSVDGSSIIFNLVKVVNTARATVHEFVHHTREVISISTLREGPLFVSCGLDDHVRMFNLKSFKEIISFRITETPLEMRLIDENHMYIRSRKNILTWNTNHFNVNFCTLRSRH